jgi:hypothetical protein
MANLNSVDAMGNGINSPEALMMYEQFGRVGNSTSGQAYQRTAKVDQLTFVDDTGTYVYIGNAVPSSSSASAVWKIRRVTTTNPVKIEYAAGSTLYNQVWDNRASLSYS